MAGCVTGGYPATAARRFEVAAWVDHFDFAGVRQGDGYMFDTETAQGCAKILEHVQEVGTTTVLWRNCAGATMRYQSRIEAHHGDSIPDKRRVPDNRVPHGWVRYGEAEPDLLRNAMRMCRERGLKAGVHWPFEEAHWAGFTIGGYNLEHPQCWCRTVGGQPWWGRCSLAYGEVMAHKLALLDELVERDLEVLFIDFSRSGAWGPLYEYVEPVMAAYRERYGAEPPADRQDPRWVQHIGGYVTAFMRGVRQRLDASGREIELMAGIPLIAPLAGREARPSVTDWQGWIDENLLDGLVINSVRWDPQRPLESTRELCREVMAAVGGRCRVLWPVSAYDFSGCGMPSYTKATGLSQQEIATQLMEMAWEESADGISLECVDYNNYAPETRERMRAVAEGKCKSVRAAGEG